MWAIIFSRKNTFSVLLLLSYLFNTGLLATADAENELIYDEEQGIIFSQDGKAHSKKTDENVTAAGNTQKSQQTEKKAAPSTAQKLEPASGPGDLHIARKKDPPELYFKSGLEYFKNKDFQNAMRNFTFANNAETNPKYLLWIGKTYRQLDMDNKMFEIMNKIVEQYPESDIADDALFELAFYYQRNDDYYMAEQKYAQLAEQYPFGTSFSNGQKFLDISRKQRRLMRADMGTKLKILGYTNETLQKQYKAFQNACGISVTGTGTMETIKAIKQKYDEKIDSEEKMENLKTQASVGIKWALIIGTAMLLNLILILFLRIRIKQQTVHLASLHNLLSDLKLDKYDSERDTAKSPPN